MKLMVGHKLILTNITPYGVFGHNETPPKFISIEIVEINLPNKGEFTNTEGSDGVLAKGSDGYMYGKNYPTRNEGRGDSSWARHCSDSDFEKLSEEDKDSMVEDLVWFDVAEYQCPSLPKFVEAFPDVSLRFCETHQKLYYEPGECFYCKYITNPGGVVFHQGRVTMTPEKHSWVGWY